MIERLEYIYKWCSEHQVDVSVQTHFRSKSVIIYMTAPFEHHQTMKIVKMSDIENFQGGVSEVVDDILSKMLRDIRDKEKVKNIFINRDYTP